MLRTLSFVLVLVMASWAAAAAPPVAPEYQNKELADAGASYRQDLLNSIPAAKHQPALIPRLRKDAEAELRAQRWQQAIDDLTQAIAFGANDGVTWLHLAQAQYGAQDDHAMASAYNAYLRATDKADRAGALFVIGRDLDRHSKFKEALTVFRAGLAINPSPAVAERVTQLERLAAYRVTKVEIQSEADVPSVCLRLNEPISTAPGISFNEFIRSEPQVDGIVTGRGDTVCVNGLKHGGDYRIQLLAGFPSATGEKMRETYTARVVVPDRKPRIQFSGTGYVLPREGSAGLPVTTINVSKVKLRILRVNERNLVPSIDGDKLTMSFGTDDVDDIINRSGSLVWKGEMTIAAQRNRAVSTAIPLKDILKDKGPGVYLAVVERDNAKDSDDAQLATNWVLVSNLGLTAYTGSGGMVLAVRSLADAKPVPGVTLRLYARNNSELTTVKTDADGLARIPGGLIHGNGGDSPFVAMAYGPGGDFNFLEVGRAAFDLSDRGVSGRAMPGPVDAYLYTDRGIYRPGETVHLMALVRDDKADAATGLPVTLRLLRPDGVEVERRQLNGGQLGAHEADYALPRDARIGTWRVELKLDPKAASIGSIEFRVEDFVPPTLKVALAAPDQPIQPGVTLPVSVAADYYYGAPGAGLGVEATASIALDDNPYPDQPGYQFGLVDEKYAGDTKDLDAPATDDNGKSTIQVALTDLPNKTKPLAATIRVSVFEPSGRAITQTLTRPIRQRDLAIGLQSPSGDEAVAEGQPATLNIIALDPSGKRTAAKGLRWELLHESWRYDWYSVSGVWRSRVTVQDEPVEQGTIDVGADAPATLSRTVPAGRYRWEVTDSGSGAASSLRFHVGWWVESELPNVPDKLEATLDKKLYQPGDTAKLFIKATFPGEAEVAIASDKVLSLRSVTLPAGGTTIDIPVDKSWGSGVYALVSAYRPSTLSGPQQRGPGRAVGVAWLGIDPAPRTLSVAITAPDVVRPRQAAAFPIKVSGLAPGEEAYVTVAAVDEAVLKLTDFASPAPQDYYYGKRQLGVELRDLYGRLIDPRASGIGVLRSGGDQFAKRSVAGLPDKSSRVVALFSGIVKLDANGVATVRLDIPDFEGQLRLMAVAFSAHKVGSAATDTTVRDPVVTTVSLPRFLAPGDAARIGVTINNLEGPAGDYRLKLSATGAGNFTAPVDRTIKLAAKQTFNGGFTLSATTIGNAALALDLSGPNGLHIVRSFTVGVRPAQAYQLSRFVGQLQPGQSVTLDDSAASQFLPGTAEAFLSVSPRPEWDVPGLLRTLDRYPYGCIEQTTSRALPLLYVDAVAKLWHADPGFSVKTALDSAIGHIVELQRSDGSFGVWNDTDDTVPWLDAYATDFLLRAKDHGNYVPDYALKTALNWLHDYVRQQHRNPAELTAVAYAHYVLAKAKADELPVLRYFSDTELTQLPTRLAQAQLGAALALYGDTVRAQAAYAAALGAPIKRTGKLRYVDYGSDLRDNAALLAFAAGDKGLYPRLTTVMDRITELFARAKDTSTQEKAWLLMAAEAAAKISGGNMTIATNNAAPETLTAARYVRRQLGAGTPPTTITNKGTKPIWRSVSITGVNHTDLPAESNGYTVSREVFNPDGTPADLGKVRQTDLFVVVVKGKRTDSSRAVRTLVVDLLPAGFEIETADFGNGSARYDWLKDLSSTAYVEGRDDRYIAALDLGQGKDSFTLAYVVRAVTPGAFKYPALDVEDMYDPETIGRTAMGTLVVRPR
ncbi:MAG TPA: MG2 domain-containing protein [Stellaceae bacterium]|nr:MG2 domain-containing protein [Stellaceae bacterium]